jgi:hypothetical protein
LIRRNRPTYISPTLDIYSVTTACILSNSISISTSITCEQSKKNVETLALIDSGAGGAFIDQNYAKKLGFEIQKLDKPLRALNVDGTENKQGRITSYVDTTLTINGRITKERLFLAGLGKQRVILGFPWLKQHNPEINWRTGELFSWRNSKAKRSFKIKRYGPLERAKKIGSTRNQRKTPETHHH